MAEYIRVRAKDTKHVRSIIASSFDPNAEDVVDDTPGEWAEPEYPAAKSAPKSPPSK